MITKTKYSYKKIVCLLIVFIIGFHFFFTVCSQYTGEKFEANTFVFPASFLGVDFDWSYKAAVNLRAGHNIYEDNSAFGERYTLKSKDSHGHVCSYGPLLAYLFIPLTFLPEGAAYHLWFILILVIMLLSMYIFSLFFKDKALFWLTATVLLFFSYPLRIILEKGNNEMVLMILISAAIYFWLLKRNEFLVGLFIAMAILIKLYPLIFLLYFILKREWKIVLWSAVLCMIIGVLSYRNLSLGDHFLQLSNFSKTYHCQPSMLNHSLWSYIGLSLGYLARRIQYLSFLADIWKPVAAVILLGLYFPVIFLVWRNNSRSHKVILKEVSLILILATFTTISAYDYRLFFANIFILSMLYGYQDLQEPEPFSPGRRLFLLIFLIASALILMPPTGSLVPIFLTNKALLLLIFYLLFVTQLLRHRRAKDQRTN